MIMWYSAHWSHWSHWSLKHGWNVVDVWLKIVFPVHILLLAALHSPFMERTRQLLLARCNGLSREGALHVTALFTVGRCRLTPGFHS